MERKFVNSSSVVSVGYEPTLQTLEIEFVSGAVYQYSNVPKQVYDDLLAAPSIGQYVSSNIRNVFSVRKVG